MIRSKPALDLASWSEGEQAEVPQGTFLFAYSGRSMYPTLREPDFLVAEPVDFRRIAPGDVIIFTSPEGSQAVVHRVIQRTRDGYVTRGDNLNTADCWPVAEQNYIGRVFQKRIGGKTRQVYGGRAGMAIHVSLRAARTVIRQLSPLAKGLRAVVRLLQIDCLAEKLLQPVPVAYQSPAGRVVRLVSRGKVIGEYSDRAGRWIIRFPYRYFIRRDQPPL